MNVCKFNGYNYILNYMYVKKSCLGPPFSRSWASLLGCELGRPIVMRGLTHVRESLVFVPRLCNYTKLILQPLKPWFQNGFVFLFLFNLAEYLENHSLLLKITKRKSNFVCLYIGISIN
jgi:hypothetical protein